MGTMMTRDNDEPAPSGDARFATTQWSVVLLAGGSSSDARQALASLCEKYWYPIYAFVRRRTRTADEARDLTQEFFTTLIEKRFVAVARPDRGRFRSYLLGALQHFLANQWDRARAQKRGGGRGLVSLDLASAEARYALEPVDTMTAERLFERQWTLELLGHVLNELAQEAAAAGQADRFQRLKGFLAGRVRDDDFATAAGELGISENAARVAAHRWRRRYRDLLRQAVAETLADPAEIDDEIHRLFAALDS